MPLRQLSLSDSSDSCNITKPPPASADEIVVLHMLPKSGSGTPPSFATLERIRLIVGQNLSQLSKVPFVQLLHVTGITWFAWLYASIGGSCCRQEAVTGRASASLGCSIEGGGRLFQREFPLRGAARFNPLPAGQTLCCSVRIAGLQQLYLPAPASCGPVTPPPQGHHPPLCSQGARPPGSPPTIYI